MCRVGLTKSYLIYILHSGRTRRIAQVRAQGPDGAGARGAALRARHKRIPTRHSRRPTTDITPTRMRPSAFATVDAHGHVHVCHKHIHITGNTDRHPQRNHIALPSLIHPQSQFHRSWCHRSITKRRATSSPTTYLHVARLVFGWGAGLDHRKAVARAAWRRGPSRRSRAGGRAAPTRRAA